MKHPDFIPGCGSHSFVSAYAVHFDHVLSMMNFTRLSKYAALTVVSSVAHFFLFGKTIIQNNFTKIPTDILFNMVILCKCRFLYPRFRPRI